MSTTSIQQNIIYGLGEGALLADSDMLTYALRFANKAYRDMFSRYRFKCIRTRTVFRTSNGQSAYQAPSDFSGFLALKDESGDNIIDQVTPEYFQQEISRNSIVNESFTSDYDVAVSLDNVGIVQYSETVTTVAGSTTYTRDTDYTMGYSGGTITVDSTGAMADATAYYIDYLYRSTGSPDKFCLEFDNANNQFITNFDPVPDATKIITMIYAAEPSQMSGSVEPIWPKLEFAIEQGGIYYGSLEFIDDANKRKELKQDYNIALQALVQLDQDLIPKHDRIPVVMRRNDYTNRTDRNEIY
ncbi:MAG: hypothetical protein GY774_35735 [Planctomycetes bacterium]|nr:hypothetical protein [Planctomycetota bacterium]